MLSKKKSTNKATFKRLAENALDCFSVIFMYLSFSEKQPIIAALTHTKKYNFCCKQISASELQNILKKIATYRCNIRHKIFRKRFETSYGTIAPTLSRNK